MRRLDTIMFSATDAYDGVERRHNNTPYSMYWMLQLTQEPTSVKVGLGLLLAVWIDSYHAFFTRIFVLAITLWAVDMVVGSVRALADPTVVFRWTKVIDGLLRLLVITAIALAVATAEMAVTELSGVNVDGRLLSFVYGAIVIAEFSSIVSNVSYFYPALNTLGEKFSEFLPEGKLSVKPAPVPPTEPTVTKEEIK